jgi:hypothetical protein
MTDRPNQDLSANNKWTAMMWVYVRSGGGFYYGFWNKYPVEFYASGSFYLTGMCNWTLNAAPASGLCGNLAIYSVGQWTHLTWVFDGPARTNYTYVDGDIELTETGLAAGTIPNTAAVMELGSWDAAYIADYIVEDAQFFNYALSNAEILKMMNCRVPNNR